MVDLGGLEPLAIAAIPGKQVNQGAGDGMKGAWGNVAKIQTIVQLPK